MYGLHGIDNDPEAAPVRERAGNRHDVLGQRRLRRPRQPVRDDGLAGQALHGGLHRRRGLPDRLPLQVGRVELDQHDLR